MQKRCKYSKMQTFLKNFITMWFNFKELSKIRVLGDFILKIRVYEFLNLVIVQLYSQNDSKDEKKKYFNTQKSKNFWRIWLEFDSVFKNCHKLKMRVYGVLNLVISDSKWF